MSEWIIHLIDQTGYLGVGFLMFLETVFPPIPSEVIMPVAGLAAARGKMDIFGVVASGTLGAMLGNYFWYLAARVVGLELAAPGARSRLVDARPGHQHGPGRDQGVPADAGGPRHFEAPQVAPGHRRAVLAVADRAASRAQAPHHRQARERPAQLAPAEALQQVEVQRGDALVEIANDAAAHGTISGGYPHCSRK